MANVRQFGPLADVLDTNSIEIEPENKPRQSSDHRQSPIRGCQF